jgi:predicted nucleic acid-binding protein
VIYLDASYIAKCYLNEPGAEAVRRLAGEASGLASCEYGRVEFFAALHRHVREGNLPARQARGAVSDLAEDETNGVWEWLPVTTDLIREVCERISGLPARQYLRAGDALHLASARAHGFHEVYSNDRHLLASARFFDVVGKNVLAE